MRRLHILTLICMVISTALLVVSTIYQKSVEDQTIPVIQCPEAPLTISMADGGDAALLKDVTAWDEKDGDLTDQILLQGVDKHAGASTATVTYAVVDSDNHVATRTREIQYTDYQPPHFALEKELRYSVGSALRIKDRLTASDRIDGDLSDRIRVVSSSSNTYNEGTYPATFQVTNSLGDTAAITLDIVFRSYEAGEPRIQLSEYLIYQKAGEAFDPLAYLESVSGGEAENVEVRLPENGLSEGVNKVTYTCRGQNGSEGSTTLYVVIE